MTLVRPFTDADAPRWDEYVASVRDSHFAQTSAWRMTQERTFRVRSRWWLAERSGSVVGVLPLFATRSLSGGRRLFSAPGGLLADDDEAADALLRPARDLMRAEGHDWIELRDQRRRWPGLETVEDHVTMELPLPATTEALWKAFDAKLRNQIRKGEKSGFSIHWGRDELAAFHRVMLESMRDLGTPILGADYYRRLLDALGDRATVLVIKADAEPVAAMFVVEHQGTMFDPWASSPRRFASRCPNQVLYWEAMRRAIGRGLSRFDFGRSQPGSGTFRFKEQWGASPAPLFYQYALGKQCRPPTLSAQKDAFALATRVWRRLPLPLAGALGRQVRRLFPEEL